MPTPPTRRLETLWEALARSPFFAESVRGLPPTLESLARLPLTDRDAYREASPPLSEAALTGPLAAATIFRSGGTSGEPKFAAYAERDVEAFVPLFAACYRAAGLRETDRVGNVFAAGSLYASFVLVTRFLSSFGAVNFPMTTAMAPEAVAGHAKAFGINALLGFPSWLMQVAEAFAEAGVPLEKVFYAGEPLVPEEARYLKEALGVRVIGSAGYGAVDSGLMAFQCEPMAGTSVHHVLSDAVVLELLDPGTLAPLAEPGVPGLIAVTHLERLLHPVVRYPTGDLGAWEAGPCACGAASPRFALLGRGDDQLRIGYATVSYGEVAPPLSELPGLSGAVQMIKQREARRDRLVFAVERGRGEPPPDLEALAREAVFRAKPDLRKLVETGYVWPLAFRFLPPGGLPRQPVTGKLKRTLDESR